MLTCRACRRNVPAKHRQYSTYKGYDAAVAALNGLQSNFSVVEAIRKQGPDSNNHAIPEMIRWVQRIGYEPSDFDCLNPIHIAGTKGKGSTASFISSILAEYLPTKRSIHAERVPSSVGLYTSPHLRFVRERIKIDNRPISEDLFARYFWEVWDRLEATNCATEAQDTRSVAGKPVYFHFLTLVALHCYMQQQVGTAVIECGIGGEYDTTNILVQPSVCGVTSLGIDHEALLGSTIAQIAWHKSGIFKRGIPALTVDQPNDALAVLRERAQGNGTELYIVPTHEALNTIKLGLQGHFQKLNASLAISAASLHLHRLGYTNLPDPYSPHSKLPSEFVKGLESTRLGGRCDERTDLRAPELSWYIDGGHTLESIDVAGRWFTSRTASQESKEATRMLIFNQQTRDAPSLARRLHQTLSVAMNIARPFRYVIFCPNTTYRDAGYKADLVSINTNNDDVTNLRVQRELASVWNQIDPSAEVYVLGSIEEAVAKTRELGGGDKAEVLVTGSLHLVGGLIEVLESEADQAEGTV